MKTTRLLLLLTVLALSLAGCQPESVNPLVPITRTAHDPRLEGLWVAREKDEATYYHFVQRRESLAGDRVLTSPWVDVVAVEHPKTGVASTVGYGVLPAKIGARTYLSFAGLSKPGSQAKRGAFSFARYDFNWKGDLRIYLADQNALADAVRAGKLRGTVKVRRFDKEVTLTDTSMHLEAFFAAANDAVLFKSEPLVLRRR